MRVKMEPAADLHPVTFAAAIEAFAGAVIVPIAIVIYALEPSSTTSSVQLWLGFGSLLLSAVAFGAALHTATRLVGALVAVTAVTELAWFVAAT